MIYTNKSINLISFIITLIICLGLYLTYLNISKVSIETISTFAIATENDEKEEQNEKKDVNLGNWYIEIPSINLVAPIAEGTDNQTLNTKVGHFKGTALEDGNIGLAGYNIGHEFNYFENLKKLKKEDKIIYTYGMYKKEYLVDTIAIIKCTDWSYLEELDENTITLITGVENESQYRRCIQATELEL